MNMVSLLALPLVIMHNLKDGRGDRTIGGVVLRHVLFAAVAWPGGSETRNRRNETDGRSDGRRTRVARWPDTLPAK